MKKKLWSPWFESRIRMLVTTYMFSCNSFIVGFFHISIKVRAYWCDSWEDLLCPRRTCLGCHQSYHNSSLVPHLKAFSEKSKLSFLKSVSLKCVCQDLPYVCKERARTVLMLFFLISLLFLSCFQSGFDQLDITSVSPGVVCIDLRAFLLLGNNVMRTIHGVGEMMTQMVLSRGSIFPMSVPDVQPSILPSKQGSPVEPEDVTVMDTKLKIIEILQVCCIMEAKWQIPNWASWFNFLNRLCSTSLWKYSEMLLI